MYHNNKRDGKQIPNICFINIGLTVLNNSRYEKKKENLTEERLRLMNTAATIIQAQVYDKTTYPPSDNFLKDAISCVHTTILTFLEDVTLKMTKALKRERKNAF